MPASKEFRYYQKQFFLMVGLVILGTICFSLWVKWERQKKEKAGYKWVPTKIVNGHWEK